MHKARYAVALMLDESAGSKVRALAERLDGLVPEAPSIRVPPHITLATCTELDVTGFRSSLRECAEATQAVQVTLASLGTFPTAEGVVFLGPASSAELISLHVEVVERLRLVGARVEPYWIPGQWVPHCTLITGLPHDLIALAIGRVAETFTAISGLLSQVCVVEIEPVSVCYEFHLRQFRRV